MSRVLSAVLATSLLGATGFAGPPADPRVESLFEAARDGDVAALTRLLDAGLDVNAKSRYGATALSFASDKGQLAVVQVLLARGADVDVRDTFYGATPLGWAVSKDHPEIARLLVAKGAKNPETALELAIKQKDESLARAVLARGPLPAPDRALALGLARDAGASAIVTLLEQSAPAPEPEVAITAEELAKLASTYTGEDGKATLLVEVRDGRLVALKGGAEALVLVPLGDALFRAKDKADTWVSFGGRGGIIERAILQEGGRETYFGRSTTATEASKTARSDRPTPEGGSARTAALPWPQFRGTGASGTGDGQGAPSAWEVASGKNVLWKADLPGLANSSPIVWGDRIYVTTAVGQKEASFRTGLYGDTDSVPDEGAQSWRLVCLDRRTGRVLWSQVAHEGPPRVKRHTKSTHANPTPATDGRHVVAMFGSEGLYAYDVNGGLLWKKDLGVLDSGWFYDASYQWGFSSSPVLYDDVVIVQVDIQKGSFIAAFDLATGRERWRTARDEISTWGTPTVVRGEKGDELVTNGTTVRAYDPKTGTLLWSLGPNSEVVVATPVAADGIVYVTAGYPPVRPVYAVRAGARGKLDLGENKTESDAVAWSTTKEGTYIPTPLVYRGHLYTLGNNGRLSCYDARTGEVVYRTRVGAGGTFTASPVAADGRLFIATEEGDVFVVRAGPQYEMLATNTMGEVIMATPAMSDGVLLVRTLKHLYGLGEGAPARPGGL